MNEIFYDKLDKFVFISQKAAFSVSLLYLLSHIHVVAQLSVLMFSMLTC